MDPKELIAALGTFADPNASDEDKAAALEKLTAHFNALLDAHEEAEKVAAEEAAKADADAAQKASEAGDDEDKSKDDPSKEMASAIAKIDELTKRLAKVEKASAIGNAPRAKSPTVLPRKEPPAPKDHVVSMIEAAERNTLRNLSK